MNWVGIEFLGITEKFWFLKEIGISDFADRKVFLWQTVKEMNKQTENFENNFATHISNQRLAGNVKISDTQQ